jgi:hypothetical protein
MAPQHIYRGKDPLDVQRHLEYRFGKTVAEEYGKILPQIEGTGGKGTKIISPESYFDIHPDQAKTNLTILEKLARKYATQESIPDYPLSDTNAPSWLKKAQPKLVRPPYVNPLSKGTTFWTGLGLSSYTSTKSPFITGFGFPITPYQYKPTTTISSYKYKPKVEYPTLETSEKYTNIKTKVKGITTKYPTTYPSTPMITGEVTYPPYKYNKENKPPKTPIPTKETEEPSEEYKPKSKPGYNIYAKERKKWIKVNPFPVTQTQAYGIGSKVTDETTSRSFKVKATNANAQSLPKYDNVWSNLGFKFRTKKDTQIEKTSFAIDTQGEHQGITVQGWTAQNMKKQGQRYTPTALYSPTFWKG